MILSLGFRFGVYSETGQEFNYDGKKYELNKVHKHENYLILQSYSQESAIAVKDGLKKVKLKLNVGNIFKQLLK